MVVLDYTENADFELFYKGFLKLLELALNSKQNWNGSEEHTKSWRLKSVDTA